MFGADETSFGGGYAVYCLFENKEKHDIDILKAEFDAGSDLHYPALTPVLPAAAWYERELHDMFGFIPDDHPDLRPLVLHETYPEDFHPLRKCVDIDADVRGERKYEMAVSHGEGCSKYLSVLFMQVSLNRGIFDSARPVKLFCS